MNVLEFSDYHNPIGLNPAIVIGSWWQKSPYSNEFGVYEIPVKTSGLVPLGHYEDDVNVKRPNRFYGLAINPEQLKDLQDWQAEEIEFLRFDGIVKLPPFQHVKGYYNGQAVSFVTPLDSITLDSSNLSDRQTYEYITAIRRREIGKITIHYVFEDNSKATGVASFSLSDVAYLNSYAGDKHLVVQPIEDIFSEHYRNHYTAEQIADGIAQGRPYAGEVQEDKIVKEIWFEFDEFDDGLPNTILKAPVEYRYIGGEEPLPPET